MQHTAGSREPGPDGAGALHRTLRPQKPHGAGDGLWGLPTIAAIHPIGGAEGTAGVGRTSEEQRASPGPPCFRRSPAREEPVTQQAVPPHCDFKEPTGDTAHGAGSYHRNASAGNKISPVDPFLGRTISSATWRDGTKRASPHGALSTKPSAAGRAGPGAGSVQGSAGPAARQGGAALAAALAQPGPWLAGLSQACYRSPF